MDGIRISSPGAPQPWCSFPGRALAIPHVANDTVQLTEAPEGEKKSKGLSLEKAARLFEKERLPIDKILWKYETGEIFSSRPVAGADGTTYIGRHDGAVLAIRDGKELWSFDTGNPMPLSLCTGPDGRTVYAGNSKGLIVALRDGKEMWRFDTETRLPVRICAGEDGTIYAAGLMHEIYAIREGRMQWKFRTEGYVKSAPAVSSDGTVYVGDSGGKVYALKDGGKEWDYSTGATIRYSPVVSPSGVVYACAGDGKILALRDGKKLWEVETGLFFNCAPSITPDETVIAGSYDGQVAGVKDGRVQWSLPGTGEASRSIAGAASDGNVYAGDYNGNISVLKDGKKIWEVNTQHATRFPPGPSEKGTIYVACDTEHNYGGKRSVTGTLYALTMEEPEKYLSRKVESQNQENADNHVIESDENWIIIDNIRLPKNDGESQKIIAMLNGGMIAHESGAPGSRKETLHTIKVDENGNFLKGENVGSSSQEEIRHALIHGDLGRAKRLTKALESAALSGNWVVREPDGRSYPLAISSDAGNKECTLMHMLRNGVVMSLALKARKKPAMKSRLIWYESLLKEIEKGAREVPVGINKETNRQGVAGIPSRSSSSDI